MLDQHPISGQQDPHNIELVRLAVTSVTINPDVRAPRQLTLFSVMYGLYRVAELVTFAGFDLNERDGGLTLGDEIDVAVAVLEAAREDSPTLLGEPALGDSFAELAEALVVV